MKVGVVDIGTNSMRLLVTSESEEVGRWVEVTGLGVGVDRTGRLGDEGVERSIDAFTRFAAILEEHGVTQRRAIATSASRDASNREAFFDRVEQTLGVRPDLISGDVEARLAFEGATSGEVRAGVLVSDIGGGSTEFVTASESVSIDIGSVRLTDRILGSAPAGKKRAVEARLHVASLFDGLSLGAREVIGVAGTWTSLSALIQGLDTYRRDLVHGSVVSVGDLTATVDFLAPMALAEIEAIPALDPKRAPVILAGAIIASEVLGALGLDQAKVSERDTLDGVADQLLGRN